MSIGRKDLASHGKCAAVGPVCLVSVLGKVAVISHPVVGVGLQSASYTYNHYSLLRCFILGNGVG
jgi:hypothetical protein